MRLPRTDWLGRVQKLVIAGVMLAVTACSSNEREAVDFVQPGTVTSGMTVAVLPFENLTNYPNAGLIATSLLRTELYHQGVFILQEESETRRELTRLKVDPEDLKSTADAQDIAKKLDVAGVIIGSVSEFGYQQGLREEPVVGLNARLIDTSTGAVLWASSHSAMGGGVLKRGSLNATAQEVISAMVATLAGSNGR